MSGGRTSVSDVDIDLAQLFRSLLRNWLRIVAFVLLVTAAAIAFAVTATPHYRAETRILIESGESVFTRPAAAAGEADRALVDEEAITSQVQLVASRDILRRAAEQLDLVSRPDFAGAQPGRLGRVLGLIGLGSDPDRIPPEERVVMAIEKGLVVYRIDRSRVIVVEFRHEDPEMAAAIPNAIADAYVAIQQQAKLLSNEDATQWLEPEIDELTRRVREAEERVAAYRAQTGLILGQNNSILASQQLSELSSELTRVRAARSSAEARADAIRTALSAGTSVETLPDILTAPTVQRLRERQIELQGQIADLSTALLDNHPRLRAARSQLSEIEGQIRRETEKVLQSLETEATTAQQRERALVADVNVLQAQAVQANDDEVELRALERDAASQRSLLESYLARYSEAASRLDRGYVPVDARIFARASAPYDPYFPKMVPIAGAALVGSLLIGAIVTLLAELFSGRAMRPAPGAPFEPVRQIDMPARRHELVDRDGKDVETLPAGALPATAALPADLDDLDNLDGPDAGAAVAPIDIEAAAGRIAGSDVARAIFVSPEGDEAAATSVMVARAIADGGLRVIFLDLTYSGAPSASMLDSGRFPGITNLLASDAQFTDIIRADLYSDCHVIPVGTADAERAMRAVDRLPIVMQSLTTAYDVVVVECGPTDAEGIARVIADDALLMMSVIEPDDAEVQATLSELQGAGYSGIAVVRPAEGEPPFQPERESDAA
jgi:uncharacterized protein involved in exopolysaccharide biosynthesis/Mrp family chromosome partitioning ATPase